MKWVLVYKTTFSILFNLKIFLSTIKLSLYSFNFVFNLFHYMRNMNPQDCCFLQESAPQTKDLSKSLPSLDSINNSRIRNASYLGAIGDLADGGRLNDVRAGIQKVLQVFIVNSANVFLLQTDDESAMSEQVPLIDELMSKFSVIRTEYSLEKEFIL